MNRRITAIVRDDDTALDARHARAFMEHAVNDTIGIDNHSGRPTKIRTMFGKLLDANGVALTWHFHSATVDDLRPLADFFRDLADGLEMDPRD